MPAHAKIGQWDSADQVRARLISSIETTGDEKSFDMVLQKKLSPGWHSYWRSPGEAGLAPTFDWSESDNIESVEIYFPSPKRFDEMGLTTFGYADEVNFPMHVTLREPGKPANLNMKVDTLVCMEICIPQHMNVSLAIPEGEGVDSTSARLIERAWDDVPQEEQPNLVIENVVAGPKGLVVSAYAKNGFHKADVFVELPDYALTAHPVVEQSSPDDETRARLIVAPLEDGDFVQSLAGKEIRVTLTDGREAVEKVIKY